MALPTTRWTLSQGGRNIVCTEEVAPNGLEVRITYDSLPLAAQLCRRIEDAERWATEVRRRWEASGWVAVTAPQVAA